MSKQKQSQAEVALEKYFIKSLHIETLGKPEKGTEVKVLLDGKTSLAVSDDGENGLVAIDITISGEPNLLYQVTVQADFHFRFLSLVAKDKAMDILRNHAQVESFDILRIEIANATSRFAHGSFRVPPVDPLKIDESD